MRRDNHPRISLIEPAESDMIRRLFSFSETTVEEAMVPLIDVEAIGKSSTDVEKVTFTVERAVPQAIQEVRIRFP